MNIVNQEDVDVSILISELDRGSVLDGVNKLVRELLAGDIDHVGFDEFAKNIVPDRLHEMRFSKPHSSVYEERVVRLGRRLSDGDGGCVGETIARPDYEGIECVFRVKFEFRAEEPLAGERHPGPLYRHRRSRFLVVGFFPYDKAYMHGRFHKIARILFYGVAIMLTQPVAKELVRDLKREAAILDLSCTDRLKPGLDHILVQAPCKLFYYISPQHRRRAIHSKPLYKYRRFEVLM